ncbi:MAG: NAD(P)/FAD-dependent oxidoreductase [Phycisphaeraceae bacterium]|nr:NAD(P)/FAD-dependent oxidoreductase [Phycisphaeraceae bacterium]
MIKSGNTPNCDLAIIGAGAAGLMAAIFAGRGAPSETKIVLLDSAKKIGAKILIAGGGRCNVTHDIVTTADYFGPTSNNTVKKILKSFSVKETTAFFNELGVELKREDTGKLFPTTDSSRTVLDALLKAVHHAGVELRKESRVLKIERWDGRLARRHGEAGNETEIDETDDSGLRPDDRRDAYPTKAHPFKIQIDHATPLIAKRVILATGGKALPSSGSDGFGYNLAKHLGHTVTETWPALVPLVLQENNWLTALSGITLDVELTLSGKTGKALYKQAGPMLLAHFGLTGPAAMDMSRHLRDYADQAPRKLTANLFPGESFEQLNQDLLDMAEQHPTRTVNALLKRRLPDRFVEALLDRFLGIALDLPLSQLSKDDRKALCHALTALPLPVVGDRGYKYAEVTAGGVPMNEVQTGTMASKRCGGLYLCGEILDVDGRIGGYNFQWAWCSGRLAGLAVAADLA